MAFPTVTNVADAVRTKLGDDEVSGGELYTTTKLIPSIQHAVRDLFRVMQKVCNPRVIVNAYYVVPAYTSVLAPSTAGISDMGEIMSVWYRSGAVSVSVTGATANANSVDITAAGHGRSSGQFVAVNLPGITGANGLWAVLVNSSSSLTINGLVASGSYTSGGTVIYSAEEFTEMTKRLEAPGLSNISIGEMSEYAWFGDVLHLPPVSATRQLRIEYTSSATVPTAGGDTIGIDDCIDFLACRAAALATQTRSPSISRSWNVAALGPKEQADASGGMLRDLLLAGVRALQNAPPDERTRFGFRDASEYVSTDW